MPAVPLLPVIGMGGVGKSTLLGTFIQPYLGRIARATRPARPLSSSTSTGFCSALSAELELSFELTRQLGLAAPIAAADFSALRYQVQTEQQQSGSKASQAGPAPRARPARRPASKRDGVLVRMHELDHRPVILVLDTFEEWQRERPDPETPW